MVLGMPGDNRFALLTFVLGGLTTISSIRPHAALAAALSPFARARSPCSRIIAR